MRTGIWAVLALLIAIMPAMAQFWSSDVMVSKYKPYVSPWSQTLTDTIVMTGGTADTANTINGVFYTELLPMNAWVIESYADSVSGFAAPTDIWFQWRYQQYATGGPGSATQLWTDWATYDSIMAAGLFGPDSAQVTQHTMTLPGIKPLRVETRCYGTGSGARKARWKTRLFAR